MTIEVTRATAADRAVLQFVDDLAKKNAHAVGFLPMVAYTTALESNRVLLLTENSEPAGYLIHGPEITHSKIYQVVIHEELRRIEHGRQLVDALRDHLQKFDVHSLSCHVATDLDANSFWKAIGFHQVGQRIKDKTGRRWQNRYQQIMPGATIHKLAQQKEIDARGQSNLARLLLKGKLSLADVINKPPTPRAKRQL